MIHELSKTNSIIGNFLAEIRNVSIQKDSMRFRKNLERVAEIIGYEISKKMDYETITCTTPLGEAKVNVLKNQLYFQCH